MHASGASVTVISAHERCWPVSGPRHTANEQQDKGNHDGASQREQLRPVAKAFLERFEPRHQTAQLVHRAAIGHCPRTVPNWSKKDNDLKSDHFGNRRKTLGSDKVVLVD